MEVLKENQFSVNPKTEPLTKEKLKTYPGFENMEDEQLSERVFSIKTLCALLHEFLRDLQTHEGKKNGIDLLGNFTKKHAV